VKNIKIIKSSMFIVSLTLSGSIFADHNAASKSIKCPELVKAANAAAVEQRARGNAASEQVDSGGSLQRKTCLDDLDGIGFDFFSSVPSLQGAAIKAMKDKATKTMRSLACDAANEIASAGKKMLTCNAAIGIKISGSAGFGSLNVSECGGLDLDGTIDAGQHNIGNGSQVNGGLDTKVEGKTSTGNANTGSDWSNWINSP
jgi:hypothetical protein